MTTPAQLLIETGRALYGPSWLHPFAALLKVSYRTVRRWASGAQPIPLNVWNELEVALDERKAIHEAMLVLIKAVRGAQEGKNDG